MIRLYVIILIVAIAMALLSATRYLAGRILQKPTTPLRSAGYFGAVVGAELGFLPGIVVEGLDDRVGLLFTLALLGAVSCAQLFHWAQPRLGQWVKRLRHHVRWWSAVFLIIVGSGIATMGLVESDGVAAGLGVMLIVSGAFLIRA